MVLKEEKEAIIYTIYERDPHINEAYLRNQMILKNISGTEICYALETNLLTGQINVIAATTTNKHNSGILQEEDFNHKTTYNFDYQSQPTNQIDQVFEKFYYRMLKEYKDQIRKQVETLPTCKTQLQTKLLQKPDQTADTVCELKKAQELHIISIKKIDDKEWLKCSTCKGQIGWILKNHLTYNP